MKFERGAPPFVVLRRNQPAIEIQIFGARRGERRGKSVEVIGDDREFAGSRCRQAHIIALMLEIREAGRQHRQRIEHAAEYHVEERDHGGIQKDADGADGDEVVPDLGDFVGRLA